MSTTPNPAALEQLARDLLAPEAFGWAVTSEVRAAARRALGIHSHPADDRPAADNHDAATTNPESAPA